MTRSARWHLAYLFVWNDNAIGCDCIWYNRIILLCGRLEKTIMTGISNHYNDCVNKKTNGAKSIYYQKHIRTETADYVRNRVRSIQIHNIRTVHVENVLFKSVTHFTTLTIAHASTLVRAHWINTLYIFQSGVDEHKSKVKVCV